MNKENFTQAVILLGLLSFAASCRSTRTYPSYPSRDERPVVVVNESHRLPPGQEKKIYGDRSAKNYAPGQRKKYGYGDNRGYIPLIIIRTPDIVIQPYGKGRYYYRNPQGYYYWQGYDDRYYLDEQYIGRIQYDEREYRDWKYKGKKYRGDEDDDDDDGSGHGHGHGKTKYKKRKD